jgi:hypothetical protein
MASAIYLYCVVYAADVPRISRVPGGLPGAAPLTVRAAGRSLWIVIAEVPLDVYGEPALASALQDLNWVGTVAMAHEQVVGQFSRQRGCTVIPMKLFTMFSTEKRAVEATRSRAREITAAAKRISGCEEWGVRITRLARTVERKAATGERPATGAAFLAARKQVRDSAKDAARMAAESAVAAYETLATLASDVRKRNDIPDGASTPPLIEAAFLVPASRRSQFKSAAKRLAAKGAAAGTELTLTGPWPAYNFVQQEAAS